MKVQALVLAAGLSTRMGRPKMLLPWGGTTVLAHILRTLREAHVEERTVIVGGDRSAVQGICEAEGAAAVFNPAYESGEMLSSLQVGLRSMPSECEAALVVLGDQPAMETAVVRAIIDLAQQAQAPLVAPSYKNRRGHPWLLGAGLWREVLDMRPPQTPREFLRMHDTEIRYVVWNTDSILRDVDTPEEYRSSRP